MPGAFAGRKRGNKMPKGSEKLTKERKDEIIDACASLYETMSFKDITIRDIGSKTSFTRTSIYNYFQSKEEIFLSLLKREHDAWIDDLISEADKYEVMSVESFADMLAQTLEQRGRMLKLMSMNLYDMECNSRIENLVEFKTSYSKSIDAITYCLKKFFPVTSGDIQEFIYAFFPFLFGVYPYTSHTEKQKEAMKLANVKYTELSIYEITRSFLIKILTSFR